MKDLNAIWTEVEAVIAKLRTQSFDEAAESLHDSLRCSGIRSELLGECVKTVESLIHGPIGTHPELHEDLHRLRKHLKSELRESMRWR